MRQSKILCGGLSASILLFAAACAPDDGDGQANEAPGAETADEGVAAEPTPLAQLKTRGHTISFYDEGDGTLGVAERSAIGEPWLLAEVQAGASPSEIYARLGEEAVPERLLEFEKRHGIVSSPVPSASEADGSEPVSPGGFPVLKHENGPVHFDDSHCPQQPYAAVWSGFAYQHERDQAKSYTNITVRKFCWSAGHVGAWTESANAAVMSNAVAAVSGSVCFTRTKDTGSASWTIMQGEQLNYNTYNRPALWDAPTCPSGWTCSSRFASVNAQLTASVTCAEAGDVWRWGGIFKKNSLTGFQSYY